MEKMFVMNNGKASCAFTAYTPVWEEDGVHFKAWIVVGTGRRDEHGGMDVHIDSLPINPEEIFTGALRFVEAGAPPPVPLTITREEFLESNLARE